MNYRKDTFLNFLTVGYPRIKARSTTEYTARFTLLHHEFRFVKNKALQETSNLIESWVVQNHKWPDIL